MAGFNTKWAKDVTERVFWTAAQVAVGVLITSTADWDTWYALPIAAGLSFIKGAVAKKIGNPDSASTVKGV